MLGGVVASAQVAHQLLLTIAGSSLSIPFADRMSSRGTAHRCGWAVPRNAGMPCYRIGTAMIGRGLCAYISFPDVLQNRIVHHFVDNTAAFVGSIKAFSSKLDCARVIDALVSRILQLSRRPWFGSVYSGDNLSDLPSRGSLELLVSLGSTRRVLVRPSLATLGCNEPTAPGCRVE